MSLRRKPNRTRSPEEARAAIERAKAELDATKAQWPEVHEQTTRLRWYVRENHLAELMWAAMGGKPT